MIKLSGVGRRFKKNFNLNIIYFKRKECLQALYPAQWQIKKKLGKCLLTLP